MNIYIYIRTGGAKSPRSCGPPPSAEARLAWVRMDAVVVGVTDGEAAKAIQDLQAAAAAATAAPTSAAAAADVVSINNDADDDKFSDDVARAAAAAEEDELSDVDWNKVDVAAAAAAADRQD